jgi:eukaryotic-like serine/threonine-protein kinase
VALKTASLPIRYRDPSLVAHGGMGEVYRATDTTLGRAVAVKVLGERYAHDETVRKRFSREALAAARLSSEPSTVTIFDVGEWEGRPFIVMEYVAGGSLEDVLRREGAQPPPRVLEWLEQAAQALDHAHGRGVVHRDVKPANLLIGSDGRVRVADFGVASAMGLDSLTQTGTIIGTAGYLSPEQAEGRETTAASDCYALGVVAFELLTGARPYESDSTTAEAMGHVQRPVPSIAARRPGLPAELDAVFARAMAKDPRARFSTCAELVAALRAAFADAAGTTRIVSAAPTPRRQNRLVLPIVLLLLLAGGILAAVLLTTRGGESAQGPLRVTVTRQGTTVRQTVTLRATPPPARATTAPPGSTDGLSDARAGFAKMQAGDYAGALRLLEQAAQKLMGSGSLDEAYNDYNLAFTLAKIQGCSPEILQLLDASQAIQGRRRPIDELRHACKKSR